MNEPQPPSGEQLDAYIRTRLALAGVDLDRLPEETDPETGVPGRDVVLRSLRAFVTRTPPALAGWAPPADGDAAAAHAQQAAPPLLYPSIAEAWTGRVEAR